MTRLGLSSADLVKASTDQLSFKMVQKGRSGRHLTVNVQEKILRALLAVKPDLKVRRRELFQYEPDEAMVAGVSSALALIRTQKIKYPQFIDLLAQAGVHHYAADVATSRATFYGAGGQAHEEVVDLPTFLEKIPDAGIGAYEVNIRNRQIRYQSDRQSYKETIPLSNSDSAAQVPKPTEKTAPKSVGSGKTKRAVKIMKKRKLWKAVKLHRVKKRQFKRTYW